MMQAFIRYRAELMGLAIVWTLFYHAAIELPRALLPVQAVQSLGMVAVDIFFLLSGIGLSYSWQADPSPRRFLHKRLIRVLPAFWFFVLLSCLRTALEGRWQATDALRLLGLDFFWQRSLDRWFIPSIMVCYLLFVLAMPLVRRWGAGRWLVFSVLAAVALSLALSHGPLDYLLIFTVRLPVFWLGVYIGQALVQGRSVGPLGHRGVQATMWVLGTCGWLLVNGAVDPALSWHLGLWWYPTMVMACPLCLVLCWVLARLPKAWDGLQAWLARQGTHSLELYLTHAFIYSLAPLLPLQHAVLNPGRVPEYLLYAILSIWLAPLVTRYINAPLVQRFKPS